MNKTLTVRVTQDHINRGGLKKLISWTACPIELALHDLGILKPCVSANEWYPDLEPGAIVQEWLPLTRRAKRFIRDFDATGKAEPATFRLPLTTSPS